MSTDYNLLMDAVTFFTQVPTLSLVGFIIIIIIWYIYSY